MSDTTDHALRLPDFVSYLPERIWYLTATGTNMWCRRPYGFFFTSSEAAERFALRMGTGLSLTSIGVKSRELVSEDGITAMRRLEVTRIFIDPAIDEATGDVFGRILRIDPVN